MLPLYGAEVEKLESLLNLFDYENAARGKMPGPVYEYIASGAADELTLRRNREAYDEILLSTSVLTDVSRLDSSVTLFGHRLSHPILFAPTALHRSMHPEGELATVRGAGKAGAILIVSTGSTVAVEEISRAATRPIWFQLYVQSDRGFSRHLVQRAAEAGCQAVCVTVDSPALGARNREKRSGYSALVAGLEKPHYEGFKGRARLDEDDGIKPLKLTWNDIAWFKSQSPIPVLLKGIMNPRDAEQAIGIGVDGIMVSNHGGRVLDTMPSTIEVLPAIVDQVAGRVPILVDGGIRRGTDVLKAIALGASAVMIGRPYLYGLGVNGADGVADVANILVKEFHMAMAIMGRPTLASLDRSVIWKK